MNLPQQIIANAEACNIVLYLKGEQLAYISEQGSFPENLKAQIREHKNEISAYLRKQELEKKEAENKTIITPVDKNAELPLTFAQQGLWFIDQLEGGSNQYNIHAAFGLKGELNLAAVQWAVNKLIERHQVLRTAYVEKDGEVYQKVQPLQYWELPVIDLTKLAPQEQQQRILQVSAQEMNQTFNLQADLMLKAKVVARSEQDHILFFTLHHIASDAWSQAIMVQEFVALYESYCKKRVDPLPKLDVQYCDYAHWQRNYYNESRISEQLVYWEKMLKGAPYSHSLPLDRPRGAQQKFTGKTYSWFVDAEELDGLKAKARENQATLFMILYTAFSVLIGRWSGTRDVVIGSPIAGRTHPQVASMIGYFINSLTYRTKWKEGESFRSLLNRNKKNTLTAFDHQDIPFDSLVERLKIPRELSHSPLFQVMFTLQNTEKSEFELDGLSTYPVMGENSLTKYDLQMVAEEGEKGLWLNLTYSTDLFDTQTVQSMSSSFTVILRQLAMDIDIAVDKLALTPTAVAMTTPQAAATSFSPAHSRFEDQVEKKGDAIAIECGSERMSYKMLNTKANQLARYLLSNGLKHNQLVHICAIHGISRYIAQLAVLKAGSGYEYHGAIQNNQWLGTLTVDPDSSVLLPNNGVEMSSNGCILFPSEADLKAYSGENLDLEEVKVSQSNSALADSAASSGQMNQGMLLEQVLKEQKLMELDRESVLLLHPHMEQVYRTSWLAAIVAGSKLSLLTETKGLVETLVQRQITHLTLSNSILANVPLRPDYALKKIIVDAESGADALLWRWSELYPVITGLSVGLLNYVCSGQVSTGEPVMLGSLCDTQQAKVMYDEFNQVPNGAIGYLYISGQSSGNLENSGLLVRKTNQGVIELVHIRETKTSRDDLFLEQKISTQFETTQVAVVDGVVYLRLEGNKQEQQEKLQILQQALKKSVPTYILPSSYVLVANMPITDGGTVERNTLWRHSRGWQDELEVLPQPELLELSINQQGINTKTVDFFCNKEVSSGISRLANQYNTSIAHTFAAIYNLALAVYSESSCILTAVSGLPSSNGAGFMSGSFSEHGNVLTKLNDILTSLLRSEENGFLEQSWVTQQYNKQFGTNWDSIFVYQLKFIRSELLQKHNFPCDSPVSLLIADDFNGKEIKGQWCLRNSSFEQSSLSRIEKIMAMLISHEMQSKTLADVKMVLNEGARSKLRSVKRKFKSARSKKQLSVEGNVA
ncbi:MULTISPECIES: condensation domain-containing protein [unclassified Pseudoalteromonas]|uniref:condensation domain-containing protein n=1 Tax=unclassified Pseudoalteromonas TaxID=194690 RepID=UPI00301433B7